MILNGCVSSTFTHKKCKQNYTKPFILWHDGSSLENGTKKRFLYFLFHISDSCFIFHASIQAIFCQKKCYYAVFHVCQYCALLPAFSVFILFHSRELIENTQFKITTAIETAQPTDTSLVGRNSTFHFHKCVCCGS